MKRKAQGTNTKSKAAKVGNDIVTIIHENDSSEYPTFDEDDILSKLIHPLPLSTFKSDYFRQKALVVHAAPSRYDQLIATGMCDLNVEQLLQETSSEEYQAWVQTKDKKIESVKVHSVQEALTLHRAGHSLYMRSSEELASLLIPALAKDLGMGFTTTSLFNELNGEIEIFCGKAGHTTDWHFDFMENFTLQLQGTKTWKLKKSTIPHPLRGCTPHYKTQDVVEQQLKLHRLTDPNFSYTPQVDSGDDYISITLHPGSMLYFPGGMWHRVECADDHDSISMNLSMFSTPYADVMTDALRHFLLKSDAWRAGIYYDDVQQAHGHVQMLLNDLKKRISELTPADILPERLLLHGRDGQLHQENNHDSHDDNEEDSDANEEEHVDEEEDENDQDEEEHQSNVVDLSDPNLLTDSTIVVEPTAQFRHNPLGNLMAFTDIPSIHHAQPRDDVHDAEKLFILNIGFGHASYTSSMRVEFVVSDAQLPILHKIMIAKGAFTPKELGKWTRETQVLLHFLCHAGYLTKLN